jgi:hypothetical protein
VGSARCETRPASPRPGPGGARLASASRKRPPGRLVSQPTRDMIFDLHNLAPAIGQVDQTGGVGDQARPAPTDQECCAIDESPFTCFSLGSAFATIRQLVRWTAPIALFVVALADSASSQAIPSCDFSGELISLDLSTGTHVFDFEDGLQGWHPCGSAERVSTGVLGGDWAVFGDGLAGLPVPPTDPGGAARLLLEIEPIREVEWIEVDLFFLGTYADLVPDVVVVAQLNALSEEGFVDAVFPVRLLAPDPTTRMTNPGRRVLAIPEVIRGQRLIGVDLQWSLGSCVSFPPSDTCLGLEGPNRLSALIDNVTFLPEPDSQPAVILLTLALVAYRRKHGLRRAAL